MVKFRLIIIFLIIISLFLPTVLANDTDVTLKLFYSNDCPTCKDIIPMVEDIKKIYEENITLLYYLIDEESNYSKLLEYDTVNIPTIILINNSNNNYELFQSFTEEDLVVVIDDILDLNNSSLKKINHAPIIIMNGSFFAYTNQEIKLNAENSYDPDNDTIISYIWTFNDETIKTGKIITHSYSEQGFYKVTLTVTDDRGRSKTNSSVVIIQKSEDSINHEDEKSTPGFALQIILFSLLFISILTRKKRK